MASLLVPLGLILGGYALVKSSQTKSSSAAEKQLNAGLAVKSGNGDTVLMQAVLLGQQGRWDLAAILGAHYRTQKLLSSNSTATTAYIDGIDIGMTDLAKLNALAIKADPYVINGLRVLGDSLRQKIAYLSAKAK